MVIYFSRFLSLARKGILVINPEPSRLVVGWEPLGATDPSKLRNDYLYLGKVSELPTPEIGGGSWTNFILLEDEKIVPTFLEHNHSNIMLTTSVEEYDRLCKEIQVIFDTQMQVNLFANKLLSLVQNEATTEKLLELGYQILGNPLLLLDPSLCLLASAGTDSIEKDSTIEYTLSKGYMPKRYLEEIMEEEGKSPEDDRALIIWNTYPPKHRLVAGRIMRGNRLIGYLKLFEHNRSFTEILDTEILGVLCQYLAINMDSATVPHKSGSPFIETFLLDIVEQKLTDHEAIQERADLHNFELQTFKGAIIVEIEEHFHKLDKLYLLKQMFQTHFKRNTVFIHDTELVILYDRDTPENLYDKSQAKDFRQLLETNHCRAAASLPFQELDQLHNYFNQARACFQIADRLRITDRVLLYGDLLITHMLLRFSEALDLHDLINPLARKLRELDSQKGGDLTKTLFSYIRHHQDITVTSKAMHIHYNTLKYRISRIREVTGIDFNDENVIFRIMLSERVIKLLERLENSDAPLPRS